ncbi:hypothetical protein FH608_008185 [Nonomuraea phyllanthi]|uniref:WD40 repeat domain-containing protein n=1 Tax=Nonomuraea phyllanthi TaxID=2219224 RepID=A0A5C4WTY5_9ACTN|nr:hypothetical protein [Nonomuraea phyllanthi]KAB8196676.1 hypothetical protein FH608_008185 [Nonomuraea phyllanthi]
MTRLLRDNLREWADEVKVPHDLADRALRRRARRPVGMGALATVLAVGLVAAIAVAVAGLRGTLPGPDSARPASGIALPARPSPAPTDVRADTEHSPPATLVAAGRMAMSAYYTISREQPSGNLQPFRRVWSLYDPRTGGYERTSWGWVDAAPGLQVAAVLDGDLVSRRLGILDMNSRQILKWFDLEHPVGSVTWSPDGTRVLATAYSSSPDVLEGKGDQASVIRDSPRTGYYIVDVEAGTTDYHELPPMADGMGDEKIFNMNARQDLGWSLDGSLLWAPTSTMPDRVFYTLDGEPAEWPEGDRYVDYTGISATSPDGRLVLGDDGLPTRITDAATGEIAGRQRVLQLHAWADDDDVIALGCAGTCENEFNNGMVLVSVDGERTTQLTRNRDTNADGAWRWVLTPR